MIPTSDLAPETVESLSAFLTSPDRPKGTLGYVAVRGYLFAVANAPRMLKPSEWIHRIFGENGSEEMIWDDASVAQEVYGWLIAVWNDVFPTVDADKMPLEHLFGEEMTDESLRRNWSTGFQAGWALVEQSWHDSLAGIDDEHGKWFGVCQYCLRYFSDPETHNQESDVPAEELEDWAKRMDELFATAAQYYARLGKTLYQMNPSGGSSSPGTVRVEKGPGRNDPCPCGSGKKFKKCCLN